MRNDAPSVLAEWAALTNAETRTFMYVSVTPEIPERPEARAYLSGLLSDDEAAARVAADLERVRAIRGQSWADTAADYHKERGNRVSLVEYQPEQLARLRALLGNKVTLERAKAEIQTQHERQRGAAAWTVEALMFDLRARGTEAFAYPKVQGQISQLGDEQITEVAARLRQLEPHLAKAWTTDEAQQLIAKWGVLHRDRK